MNKGFSLVNLSFKMFSFNVFIEEFYVISQVFLVSLLVQRYVLVGNHCLSLGIEEFNLVFDAVVNCLVKYFENIVLLPYIGMDVLEIFLFMEQLPVLKLFELFEIL